MRVYGVLAIELRCFFTKVSCCSACMLSSVHVCLLDPEVWPLLLLKNTFSLERLLLPDRTTPMMYEHVNSGIVCPDFISSVGF